MRKPINLIMEDREKAALRRGYVYGVVMVSTMYLLVKVVMHLATFQ